MRQREEVEALSRRRHRTAPAVSEAAAAVTSESGGRWHLRRFLIGALVIVVIGAAAYLLGWDIRDWFADLWDTITEISAAYLVGAIALKTIQTTATAFAWFAILRYAYPTTSFKVVLACYATSVALNGFLPANIGTFVMLLMFTTIIAAATFSGVIGGYVVQKIFFTLSGAFTYLYLFLSVSGSFDVKFAFVHEHPWATAILVLGIIALVYLLVRAMWPKVVKWWDDAKEGGGILSEPRKYLVRVFCPELIAWLASLGVMAVFLAAYDIPVSFHTLMRIAGGNSIANVTSVTPGGAGVNQAFNVASLNGVTDATTATAYSVAQQLVTTAWNILFAIVAVTWVFGWTGGKELVRTSYSDAKDKAAEQKTARADRKEAKRAAKHA
jgi:uncharacterized membrane protein YbhN (UPF0104 family)